MSRREFMAKATGVGAFLTDWAGLRRSLTDWAAPVIEKAYAAGPCSGHLTDIEHIVLCLQENRSFDHYFGSLSSVDGFDTPTSLFQQKGWDPRTQSVDPAGTTVPYRIDTTRGPNGVGECVNDPDHQWIAAQGGNDGWLAAQARTRSQANTPVVMGYYARPDMPIHYLLADTFTICDQYHSSLLGGTMPNRLYWISGTVNPDGDKGGPQIVEPTIQPKLTFSWRLMPENLSDAGVSWKVYNSKLLGGLNDTSLSRNGYVGSFKQAGDPRSDLARYGIAPRYPADFVLDIMNNRLPQVSWVVPLTVESEHPSFPVAVGAVTIVNLIRALLRNPAVWEKTALIIAYDEHGGFFDHVTPPTPPEGTPGEWIPPTVDINTVDGSGGIRGPIGLGYRVPCFVISPYSRGGLLAHERFDHTSQLQLIGKRFGVPVPNLTPWRASVTGDMTSAFNFAVPPNPSQPNLDHPAKQLPKLINCVPNAVLGFLNEGLPYRVPYPQTTPTQESGPVRGVPSGIC
ncbi:phospholipase C [Mycobacterium sp. 012931]|uniref:phospholipase C n=1 Tax=Mycobacterium sp. 012931 TaxID=1187065 RepID=UPI0012679FB9|nr:phospholipase C [Mycobacterium sp. 012931]